MENHLIVVGILLMALALIHIIFPKYFNWKEELKSLSLMNKQMMFFHMFFIAVAVFLMGLLCLVASKDLISTDLGKKISLGLGIFWALRLLTQFFGYSKELWKGKTFETIVHVVFSIFWIYLTVVFFRIYFL